MDVLLAHGYFLSADREEQRIMRPHPPLGVLYLSSHLKAKGFDVGVFDSTFRRIEDFDECVRRVRPPVVGLAVNLMTKRNVLRMIAVARAAGARVVVGGPDPPHYAEEYLGAGADVVVDRRRRTDARGAAADLAERGIKRATGSGAGDRLPGWPA